MGEGSGLVATSSSCTKHDRPLAFSPPAYLQPLPPCGSPALQPVGHESHLLLLWSLYNLEESFNFSKPIYEVFDVEISCESWDVHFEAKILKACRLVESSAIATVLVESAAVALILVEPISVPLLFTIVVVLSKRIFMLSDSQRGLRASCR